MVWRHGVVYEGVWNLDHRPEDAVAREWDAFFHLSVQDQRARLQQWIILQQAAGGGGGGGISHNSHHMTE